MRAWQTCRVCRKATYEKHKYDMIRTAVRHWAHPDCALRKWGAAWLKKLSPHQLQTFPYMAAVEAGHQKALEAEANARPCKCRECLTGAETPVGA